MRLDIELPLWSIRPNWREPIVEKLEWLTGVVPSTNGVEQRIAYRLSPRRSFEMLFNPIDDVRSYFDLWLHRMGSTEFMVPLFHDAGRLSVFIADGSTFIPFDTTNREFVVGGLAMLMGDDPHSYDKLEVLAISDEGITVAPGNVTRAWGKGATVHALRRTRISQESLLAALTSRVGACTLQFELNQANDIADEGEWGELYNGYPILLDRPNRRETIDLNFERNSMVLDNDHGLRALLDDAGRAFTVQTHNRMIRGRADHMAFRQFLYRLRGQQGGIWVPTFNRDLKLSRPRLAGDAMLDVKKIGYNYTGGAVSGRRHVLLPGDTATEITGTSGAPTTAEERLVLAAPLAEPLEAGAFASFMDTCRLAGDSVEITHHTDTDGVAECVLGFRAFLDERVPPAVLSIPIPSALKTNDSCGDVPQGDEASCVPDFPPEDNSGNGGGGGGDSGPGGLLYDWALIEIGIPAMPDGRVYYSARMLSPPIDPPIEPYDWPEMGFITYDGAWSGEYRADPVLAFPFGGEDDLASVADDTQQMSLRVDLRSLPSLAPIQIGIYGRIEPIYEAGGTGLKDGVQGEIVGSDFYGVLTHDYSANEGALTPANILAAPKLLRIKSSYNGFGRERLIATYPELNLESLPYEYTFGGYGNSWQVDFQYGSFYNPVTNENDPPEWRHFYGTTLNDPNAFLGIYPNVTDPAYVNETEYYPGSTVIRKTTTTGSSNFLGPSPTIDNVTHFDTPPQGDKQNAEIMGGDGITLYSPTWRFSIPRTSTIKAKAVKGANPWDRAVEHTTSRPDQSYTWENSAAYPTRLALTSLGSVTVPAADREDDDSPYGNFGLQFIGTVTISRTTGAISFNPA